jgi:hypothetical protein
VSKKRKRPSENNLEKIHATKVNLAKLVKKLNRDEDYDEGVSKPKSKRSRKRKDGCKKGLVGFEEEQPGQTSKPVQPPTKDSRSSVNILSEKSIMRESAKTVDQPTGMSYNGTPSLTALQKGMKQSLDGARFRSAIHSQPDTDC